MVLITKSISVVLSELQLTFIFLLSLRLPSVSPVLFLDKKISRLPKIFRGISSGITECSSEFFLQLKVLAVAHLFLPFH